VNTPAATRPLSPKIDRSYPKPKLKLPPGACDCHFHFIGPQQQFTLKPKHVFSHLEFEDTPIEDWLKMQEALGLSRGLDISTRQAQEFLDRFFARHPKVKAYLSRTVAEGRERGFVATLLGRRRYLPELRSGNPNLRGFGERMATNAPIQGTAADLVKIAMVRMAGELESHRLRTRMLLQVHDELLFEVPADEVERLQALATQVMESAITLEVPLKVDVKVGDDWAAV